MTKNSFVAEVTFKDMRILCVIYLPRAKQPPELFYKKGVNKNLEKFVGKHKCRSLFLI